MSLEETHQQGETLRRLLNLRTYPLAVKLCKNDSEFPDKVKRPRDMSRKWAICQAWALARTTGFTVGITPGESICPPSNILFGWAEMEGDTEFINAWLDMRIAGSLEGVKRYINAHCWLKKGEFRGLVFSPLQWTKVIPDVIIVYCNPAQAGVLISSSIYKEGESFSSTFRNTAVCATAITGTIKKGGPNIAIPCTGERGQAMSQDDELIFSFPGKMLPDIVKGLEANRERGIVRMPTVPNLFFQPDLISSYSELEKKLRIIE